MPNGQSVAAALLSSIDAMIRTATGPVGLLVVFVFSLLCAVVLPLPGELVLLAPIDLGLPHWGDLAVVVVVAAAGKAAGGVLALAFSANAVRVGRVHEFVRRVRVDQVVAVTDAVGNVVRQYGTIGLVAMLAVPGSPDTAAIYAFSLGKQDYVEFAVAAFVGTVVRLVVVLGFAGVVLAVLPSNWL